MTPDELAELVESIENEIKALIKSGDWSEDKYNEMVEKMQPALEFEPASIEVVAKYFDLDW